MPCKRCNTTWMKALEDRVRPILIPLMEGRTTTLTPVQQRIIVRWLLKTVMNYEFLKGRKHTTYFHQNERHAIMQSLQVPECTKIFLARYRGKYAATSRDIYLPFTVNDPNSKWSSAVEAYSITIAIKELALQVFSIRRIKDFKQATITLPLAWDRASLEIWPVTGNVIWPPAEYFDDAGLDMFTTRFGRITSLDY